MNLSYSELISIPDFKDRFEYLKLSGKPGNITFGHNRHLNQALYHSDFWARVKRKIILRDQGCDLAHPDYVIPEGLHIYIHHLNPITEEDILNRAPCLSDPENLVCTTFRTHQAIHYGDEDQLAILRERKPGDTCPWR